jgi:DNA-binding protein HU-beta
MTTISKKELAQRVAKTTRISQIQVETVLNELLEQTKKALIKDEEIRFIGYYSLRTAMTSPRMAMNLQTGKKMKVPAKRVPKCKFSLVLKAALAPKNKK